MANKLPALQFYIGDWKKDAELSMCSISTRGFWIELLGAMHELGRSGQITGTAQQLARVCRCTPAEASDAIRELTETRTANISERGGVFNIINRRMKREFKEREAAKGRVQKFRENKNVTFCNENVTFPETFENNEDAATVEGCNANVTPYSSSSSSASSNNTVTSKKTSETDVRRVFEHWQAKLDHPKAKLDATRRRLILTRLKDFSADDLISAINGVSNSPYHLGENQTKTRYDDFKTIFRDVPQVEKFLALAAGGQSPPKDDFSPNFEPSRIDFATAVDSLFESQNFKNNPVTIESYEEFKSAWLGYKENKGFESEIENYERKHDVGKRIDTPGQGAAPKPDYNRWRKNGNGQKSEMSVSR